MEVLPSNEVIKNLRAALMAALEVIENNDLKDNNIPDHHVSVKKLGMSALNNMRQINENLIQFQNDFRRYYNRDSISERSPNSLVEWMQGKKELFNIYATSANGRMIASDNEPYYGG